MEIGEVFLISALVFSAVAIVAFVAGLRRQKLLKIAAKALYGYAAMLTHAFFLLLYYFLTRDFSVKYVFEHSDAYLPLLYTISAVWAGKEGSLLLWAWFVALLNVAFFRIEKRKRGETDRVTATSLAISSSIVLFFSVLLVTTSNPFSRLDFTPVHGMGLNPMLRTLEMALHPLAIFVGYAAVTFPFALAISGVLYRENWIKRARSWLLFAWISLSIGIFLGAWWAYKTLGWGGFWAWDPVENASLLPWLTASALIHGMIVEERRRGLKTLNYFLAVITFNLVILATFITRSGIVSSVHAYEADAETFYLIPITAATLLGIVVWFVRRSSNTPLKGTREAMVFVNMLVLLLILLVILLGTFSPLLGAPVDRSYYEKVVSPLATFLVVLVGICSALNWVVDRERFLKQIGLSAGVGLIGGILVFAMFKATIAGVCVALFLFSLLNSIRGLNTRRAGGHIVHIGILLIFLGCMGAWVYETSYRNVVIEEGGSVQLDGFELHLRDIYIAEDSERIMLVARVDVYENGELQWTAYPKLVFYKPMKYARPVPTVEIISQPTRDLYLAMRGFSMDFKKAYFEFYVIPLVSLVWLGSLMVIAGGCVAMIQSYYIIPKK